MGILEIDKLKKEERAEGKGKLTFMSQGAHLFIENSQNGSSERMFERGSLSFLEFVRSVDQLKSCHVGNLP